MKTPLFSKNSVVHHESELPSLFHEMLHADPDLSWCNLPGNTSDQGRADLEFDGQHFTFRPVYKLSPSVSGLDSLVSGQALAPLLITPELSPKVLEGCRERRIAAMDLNGRVWLRAPGLLVDRGPLPGRSFQAGTEPRDIFTGKSARIVRCLLTDRDRVWTQSEIVPRTKASPGLVSRIVRHLITQGFAAKTSARSFKLRDHLSLLDAWADSDRMARRASTASFAGFLGSPLELARRLQEWALDGGVPIAFTQWTAAWVRHPFTEPVICSAYVAHLPDAPALERLALRPVEEGGKLQLHVPEDEGVLTETQPSHKLTLVTDAQIYLDLQRSGLRGPEAAAALRDWEGFCRP